MRSDLIAVVVIGVAALAAVMGLTAVGARRRGRGPAVAVLAGVLFPITWAVWYLRDERPYEREHASRR